jgi:hypothetical protein
LATRSGAKIALARTPVLAEATAVGPGSAHLAVEIVAAALIRNEANVRNTTRALGVPSGDLRKLVLVDQRLADAAVKAVELRLDDAEAKLCEALHCDDSRRRDAISMLMLCNTQRASKRGYAVAGPQRPAARSASKTRRLRKLSSSAGVATVRIARRRQSSVTGRRFRFRDMTKGVAMMTTLTAKWRGLR